MQTPGPNQFEFQFTGLRNRSRRPSPGTPAPAQAAQATPTLSEGARRRAANLQAWDSEGISPTDPKRLTLLQQLATEEQSLRRRGYRDTTYTDKYLRARALLNSLHAPQSTGATRPPTPTQPVSPSERHASEMERYAQLASSPVYPESFRSAAQAAASEARARTRATQTRATPQRPSPSSAPTPILNPLLNPLQAYQFLLQVAQKPAQWTVPLR